MKKTICFVRCFRKLTHLATVVFVIGAIAFDVLDVDLSDFALKQGQIKRVAIVAEAPKSTESAARLILPTWHPSHADKLFLQPSVRFQQKKEIQRTLTFRGRRSHVLRIVHPPPTAASLTSPA